MKKLFTFFLTAILFLFLSLGAVYWAKDRILSFVVPQLVSRVVGTKVRAKAISLSLPEQSLVIEGLEVFSPPGFPNEIMVDVPLIQANIDLDSLLKRRLYLPFLRFQGIHSTHGIYCGAPEAHQDREST